MSDPRSNMTDHNAEIIDHATGELVPVEGRQIVRSVDMRNAQTDSWTDVLVEVADLASKISGSDFVPEAYRGKTPQVAAAILHGRELGLPPLTALAMTNPIKGKPTISAEAMRALALQAGHEIIVTESSSSRVVIKGRRRGSDEWTTVSWTLEDARQAGLLRKSRSGEPTNWDRFPRQMLLARASTELCRIVFPDVIHGMRSAEELIDEIDTVTELPPAPAPQQTSTVQRQPRKTAAKKAEPKQEETPKTGEPGRTAGADDPAPLNNQPPARKRAPLPAKKTSPGAVGEAGTDQGNDPATPGPASQSVEDQQAEVRRLSEERRQLRQSQPDPAADPRPGGDDNSAATEVTTGRDTGPKITPQQRTVIIMHFHRLEVEDRDERLLWTNSLLGLEPGTIQSSSDLRQSEAVKIIQKLERLKDRDHLDAMINGQSELIP